MKLQLLIAAMILATPALADDLNPQSATKPKKTPRDADFEPVPLTDARTAAAGTAVARTSVAPCALGPDQVLPEGPVAVGFFSADMATGRRACPRTEVGLALGGDFEIDIPQFRALLGGGATVFGSYAVSDKLEVFGTFEAFRMIYSQNASLSITVPGVGQLTGGATYAVWNNDVGVLGLTGRLMLPTASSSVAVRTTAVELGALYSHRLGAGLELHGFLGSDLTFGITPATSQPRFGFLFGLGAQWSPVNWFAIALDLQSHFGDRGPFDYLAPALGFRFKVAKSVGLELGLATHVLGDRSLSFSPGLRTESVAALRGSYRF